ncbi:MAG: dihydrofolate reductase [Oscillospiraceae bacterium]
MQAIVAVSQNWGIGHRGDLLFHIKPDLQFFRDTTRGKVIVMGRTTLDSLPGTKLLSERIPFVLTRDKALSREGVTFCHSVEELLEKLAAYPSEDIFSIGGGEIYRLLLPWCDSALVTRVEASSSADAFFPNLDEERGWVLEERGERQEYEGLGYAFCRYRNTEALPITQLKG